MANAHVAPAALLIQNALGRSRIWSGTNVVSVTYRQMLHSRLLSRICRLSNNRICPPSSDFSFRAGTNTDVRSGVPGSCDLSSTEISPQNMIISAGESRRCREKLLRYNVSTLLRLINLRLYGQQTSTKGSHFATLDSSWSS
jgi:hypothetical protein